MAPEDKPRNVVISRIISESQLTNGEVPDDQTLVVPNLSTKDRDIALGQYMDCFSRLEGCLSILFWKLLQTDLQTANTVFYELGMKQIVAILVATGRVELSLDDQRRLEALARRIGKCTAKRNHLVHGRWTRNIAVGGDENDRPIVKSVVWVRSYMPTDPKQAKEALDRRNQKLNTKYHFTVPRIIEASRQLVQLTKDISGFMKTLTYIPEPPHTRVRKEEKGSS